MAKTLTADYLRSVLHYEPKTGFFTWRIRAGRHVRAGDQAGGITGKKRKYIHIGIGGNYYSAHRLAFLYMAGRWPRRDVDHRDRDSLNNQWANLRDATKRANAVNWVRVVRKQNLPRGVLKAGNRYRAQVTARNKRKHLGYFDTPAAAHQAYLRYAKREYGDYLPG